MSNNTTQTHQRTPPPTHTHVLRDTHSYKQALAHTQTRLHKHIHALTHFLIFTLSVFPIIGESHSAGIGQNFLPQGLNLYALEAPLTIYLTRRLSC